MDKIYELQSFVITSEYIEFKLNNEVVHLSLKDCGSKRLITATDHQRMFFEIDQDGMGVY